MPAKQIGKGKASRTLDARPDRIDFRDRMYQPPLVSLPPEFPSRELVDMHLPAYSRYLILDQGQEGSCTGFGLAGMINYLLFMKHVHHLEEFSGDSDDHLTRVSPRMLYHLARIYDEWPGEDYTGSSCRGAMKGWHRHGACSEKLWPYRDKRGRVRYIRPKDGWQDDAATRPLGAYYRINKDSVADMQAAINEVGAIYVSAQVHHGWTIGKCDSLPTIELLDGDTGGHAFAMVGYNADGFIVQNSWGPEWGYFGFAVMTYADWVAHGADSWVAVLGAPMKVSTDARAFSSMRLEDVHSGRAAWFWQKDSSSRRPPYKNPAVEPITEARAYEHTVVLGNDGRPINRYVDVETADDAVRDAALTMPAKWLSENQSTKLAIYAHGGLNDEAASIQRVRIMAPYFIQNGIYPLFMTWKTGFLESMGNILEDAVTHFLSGGRAQPAQGMLDNLANQIREARDRAIEVACEQVAVKSVWSQIKQNAAAAADTGSGLTQLVGHLAALKKQIPKLEIHLVGHSAGSILHGYLLDLFPRRKLSANTCALYAPACTLGFALKHYGGAHNKGVLNKKQLFCDVMSDKREKADSIGPYGKSLLYLVSRALEDVHKMPLLGMEAAWSAKVEAPDMWNNATLKDIDKWRKFASTGNAPAVHNEEYVSDGRGEIRIAHGSFDNDVKVVAKTLERILGRKLKAQVECLRGF